jgi:hypothetical protein
VLSDDDKSNKATLFSLSFSHASSPPISSLLPPLAVQSTYIPFIYDTFLYAGDKKKDVHITTVVYRSHVRYNRGNVESNRKTATKSTNENENESEFPWASNNTCDCEIRVTLFLAQWVWSEYESVQELAVVVGAFWGR